VFWKFTNHVLRPIDFNKNSQKWPFFSSITLRFWFWNFSIFDLNIIIFRLNYDKKVNFVNFFSKKWAFFSFFWKKKTIFSNKIQFFNSDKQFYINFCLFYFWIETHFHKVVPKIRAFTFIVYQEWRKNGW
jgi:hypothetical protein